MLQQPVSTYFLHVYDVELGLWVHTTLGSGVSPRIQEAMNAILLKDGILAFIGTRLEFGHYLSELKNTHGTDYRHCWTSLPASTVMSMLGLCLNMPMSGRPELVFYGSPLTFMVAYLMHEGDLEEFSDREIEGNLHNAGVFELSCEKLADIGAVHPIYIGRADYDEALSYVQDTQKVS